MKINDEQRFFHLSLTTQIINICCSPSPEVKKCNSFIIQITQTVMSFKHAQQWWHWSKIMVPDWLSYILAIIMLLSKAYYMMDLAWLSPTHKLIQGIAESIGVNRFIKPM